MKATLLVRNISLLSALCGTALMSYSQHQCLQAHFPFNGNTKDSSSNAVSSSVVGNVSSTSDRNNVSSGALDLNGTSGFLELNNNQPIITTSEFTISVWARMDGAPGGVDGESTLFEQRDDVGTSNAKSTVVLMADRNNKTIFVTRTSISTNAATDVISVDRQAYGTWHHYVAVIGSDDTLRLYIDGLQVGKTILTQTGDFVTSIDNVGIGVHRNFGQIKGLFNGAIDDFKLYSCGLSPQEIQAEYVTSFRSTQALQNYKLYPNPAQHSATLSFENPEALSFTLTVYNNQGQIVKTITDISGNEVEILKENLSSGLYYFNLNANNMVTHSGKLIIQ